MTCKTKTKNDVPSLYPNEEAVPGLGSPFRSAVTSQLLHQKTQVKPGNDQEVAFLDVLPATKPRFPHRPLIKDMLKAPLDKLGPTPGGLAAFA